MLRPGDNLTSSPPTESIPITSEDDIVHARQRARELARELGFGLVDQSRIATAVSELARNVVRYATDGRGEAQLRRVDKPDRVGLEIAVSDRGPGIANMAEAMQVGFTSGTGLGMGLPGARRLVDEMEMDSALGRGTHVILRKWRR
jgi:serine/threonine-protein kinase RsbT